MCIRDRCRRHNKKQWETEHKVRRTFTWQRANLLPVKKFVSLGFFLPPHFSFQLSRTCTRSNSEYYSFKSIEQFIDFPPSFWKQMEVNKASVHWNLNRISWITLHFFRSCKLPTIRLKYSFSIEALKFAIYFFYFQVSPSSTQTPWLSSRLSLVCS